jgi:SAM-dependent methyltransferase
MPTTENLNSLQAQFWTAAGPRWVSSRSRFDGQAGIHGDAAIKRLDPKAGKRVLDVGCGPGSTTLQLAERVGHAGSVVGLDISPTMIDGAAQLAVTEAVGNVSFAVGDAMTLSFNGDFDHVYSRFGVMFFSDATAAMANIRRALTPGGTIGFVCWQSPQANPWATTSLAVASNYVEMPFGTDPDAPGPFSFADPDRINLVLSNAGFSEIECTAHEAHAHLGDTIDDAVEFMAGLNPAITALADTDPERLGAYRAELTSAISDWELPDRVAAPSATWIVHAVND